MIATSSHANLLEEENVGHYYGRHFFVWSTNIGAMMSCTCKNIFWLKALSNITNYYLQKAKWSLLFSLGFRLTTESSSD